MKKPKPALVVDLETVGTPLDGRIISVAWQEVGTTHAFSASLGEVPPSVWAMIADSERGFVAHTKYDARWLQLSGFPVRGALYDTQVMAWVLDENQSLSLSDLAARYCGIEMDKRLRTVAGKTLFSCDDGTLVGIADAPKEQLRVYNSRDVEATTRLFTELWQRLNTDGWLDYYLAEEVPFTRTLLSMECQGIPIDLERCAEFRDSMEEECQKMAAQLLETGGLPSAFDVNSNDQLASYLFSDTFALADKLEWGVDECACLKSCISGEHDDCEDYHIADLLPPGFVLKSVGRNIVHGQWDVKGRGLKPGGKTETGKWNVSRPALKSNLATASDSWVQGLLEYKQAYKLLTTYLRVWPQQAVDGRIYGHFNQCGTRTGRLSSSNPNLQNIPSRGDLGERVRGLFRVSEGDIA